MWGEGGAETFYTHTDPTTATTTSVSTSSSPAAPQLLGSFQQANPDLLEEPLTFKTSSHDDERCGRRPELSGEPSPLPTPSMA